MAVNNKFNAYQANSVANAKPEELTLMLYNGLIRFIMQAQKGIEENNIQKIHDNIVKAENILLEFEATLDNQYEISHNLFLLYDYMYRRLVDANLKKDPAILSEVLKFGTELRDTWVQAMKNAREQANTPMVAQK